MRKSGDFSPSAKIVFPIRKNIFVIRKNPRAPQRRRMGCSLAIPGIRAFAGFGNMRFT